MSWAAGRQGIGRGFGVFLGSDLALDRLYPRIVVGGMWGLVFLLPWPRAPLWVRGVILGLAPSLYALLFTAARHQLGDLVSGDLSVVQLIVVNMLWGVVAALWLRCIGG
ncbi:MAG: hypothetical protein IPK66_01815 [Rhodospirillales bacterium]|nr:hypothetical protein [Rhodospirillales bacterium]